MADLNQANRRVRWQAGKGGAEADARKVGQQVCVYQSVSALGKTKIVLVAIKSLPPQKKLQMAHTRVGVNDDGEELTCGQVQGLRRLR